MLDSFVKYHVATSSDLSSHLVEVTNERKHLAYSQDRILAEKEIISTLRDANKNALFQLHKPTRGWYLAINAAGSNAGYIQLKPGQPSSHLMFTLYGEQFYLQPNLPAHEKRKSSGLGHLTTLFANRKNTFSLIRSAGGSRAEQELLRFEDTTGMLSTGSSGALFVNESLVQQLDVAPVAFYICVALAYLEYEEDAAAFDAANEDLME